MGLAIRGNFTDATIMNDAAYLAPTTPDEAQFDEMSYEMVSALNLAPVTPAATDFEEEIDFNSRVPVVPAEADFE